MNLNSIKLKCLLLISLSLLLVACGFKLRGTVDLPPQMKRVYIEGILGNRIFVRDLDNILELSGGNVIADRQSAGVVLHVFEEKMRRTDISLSERGKANEYELNYQIRFEMKDSVGKVVLPQQSIVIIRDYFNPQIDVIGKSEEESVIRREMYKEAARTLLRRAQLALR